MIKKGYSRPKMELVKIALESIVAVSVDVDNSKDNAPGWSDEETDEDAVAKERDGLESEIW